MGVCVNVGALLLVRELCVLASCGCPEGGRELRCCRREKTQERSKLVMFAHDKAPHRIPCDNMILIGYPHGVYPRDMTCKVLIVKQKYF